VSERSGFPQTGRGYWSERRLFEQWAVKEKTMGGYKKRIMD
jgi:hypothetical protein